MTVFEYEGPQTVVTPAGVTLAAKRDARRVAKRFVDITVSLAILLSAAPVVLVIMALIKLEDGGPIFFRQTRVGHRGEHFTMLKFRSMIVGAEHLLDDIRHMNEHDGPLFKMRHDPRVTRVGRFLRRYSLDELPQLHHALTGQMSLVGPRPSLPAEVANFGPHAQRRVLVKPGVTGLWQVSGRSDLHWEDALRLDLHYVEQWSLRKDLAILARTVKVVLTSKGAY